MSEERAEKIIRTEMACVKRAGHCSRDCASCPLVMDSEDILDAYAMSLDLIRKSKRTKQILFLIAKILFALFSVVAVVCMCAVEVKPALIIVILISMFFAAVLGGVIEYEYRQ